MDKLAALNEILQLDPANAFARYGLAMEHDAQGNTDAALVEFATKTGAKIIAEGIETQDELDTVRRLGVHYGQGFYLGRPRSLLSKEGPPMQQWRETDTMIELRVP